MLVRSNGSNFGVFLVHQCHRSGLVSGVRLHLSHLNNNSTYTKRYPLPWLYLVPYKLHLIRLLDEELPSSPETLIDLYEFHWNLQIGHDIFYFPPTPTLSFQKESSHEPLHPYNINSNINIILIHRGIWYRQGRKDKVPKDEKNKIMLGRSWFVAFFFVWSYWILVLVLSLVWRRASVTQVSLVWSDLITPSPEVGDSSKILSLSFSRCAT